MHLMTGEHFSTEGGTLAGEKEGEIVNLGSTITLQGNEKVIDSADSQFGVRRKWFESVLEGRVLI